MAEKPNLNLRGALSRRNFLKTATVASSVLIVPRHVLGGPGFTAPSDKLNIAAIGAGGRAIEDIEGVSSENIAVLCDVDWERADVMFRRYPDAARYKDFREMLDKEQNNIDAVVIAIPDHAHAVTAMAAMAHGKHVYLEKPLTHTVHEARVLARAAKEAGVATQMGNQGMAFDGNRQIKEWLADGAIGQVQEVHVWSDRPTHSGKLPLWWPQGVERPTDTPPVPETLDWDLWLGPAPYRPYHPAYVPFRWRGWWDFGEGGLGDMGIHNLAPVFSALDLGPPEEIYASSTPVYPESVPVASRVHYRFGAREGMPPVMLHWYDGGILPARPEALEPGVALNPEDGILFVGDKGTMLVEGWGGERPRLIPERRNQEYQRPPETLPRSIGHYEEWIRACKEGTPTESNFGFAGPLTEAVLLGTIAVHAGAGMPITWDSKAMQITNNPEANALLHYEYRQGWSLGG